MKKYGLFFGLLLSALLLAGQAMAATVAKPTGIGVPVTDSDGQFNITLGASSTTGVTYQIFEDDILIYAGPSRSFLVTGKIAGTYAYKANAIRTGDTPSAFTVTKSTVVSGNGSPQVVAPNGIAATANDTDGSFSVTIGTSSTAGATYTFEESVDGGAFAVVQSGSTSRVYNATGKASGSKYTYKAKAAKVGMNDSAYTATTAGTYVANSAYCAACHSSTTWAASRHGNSNATPASAWTSSCGQCHSPNSELAGGYMAVTCLGCHSFNGTTNLPDAPNHPAVLSAAASCANCHNSHYSATNSIASDFAASLHATSLLATANAFDTSKCSVCHDPHTANVPTVAICTTCHIGASVAHAGTGPDCISCHNPHSLVPNPPTTQHYGGAAFHKAQYVSDASLPVTCSSCHGSGNAAILAQFAVSGHADTEGDAWRQFDWRSGSRSTCQRCHTGTGFADKLDIADTSNSFTASDVLKPGEVLSCSTCHSDIATGALLAASPTFSSGSISYNVVGASALCARCHGGRESGNAIVNDANTTGIRAFISPHFLAAAATLYGAGYEYSTYTPGPNQILGAAEEGPCVACHMAAGNHSMTAAAPTDAATKKAAVAAALVNLKTALEAKGIFYSDKHPYFYTAPYAVPGVNDAFVNWQTPFGASAWKDTMGAAFNYQLLLNEPGAYAHDYDYTMKLITDSIAFLTP